ncbi:anti-sigma factor [Bacteroides heparinolyticus]|uniref:Anti-sigma factor n=1 Tax=Prevotella heparinolytica TaxID=28113 RepID=A0A449I172_9BACE|nr:FecR domain-containing protein [Bacteroides heparinolyticus]VFB13162.1 anti-sigma factor [Bacteroides heparinolyticus]
MENLEDIYMNNELTKDELSQLRQLINDTTDEVLSADMESRWENYQQTKSLNEKEQKAIWNRIERRLHHSHRSVWTIIWHLAKMAAVILLPIFILTSLWLYRKVPTYYPHNIVLNTGQGERVNVSLPDGSQVYMNVKSQLSYDVSLFGRHKREVSFVGEGFFEITKDIERPFNILVNQLNVKVLGTKFNLKTRSENRTVELALVEGKVELSSKKNDHQVALCPGQKAIFHLSDGHIIIHDATTTIQDETAWRRNEFVFRDKSLDEVVQMLEDYYGVTLLLSSHIDSNHLFTGTLTAENLAEDIAILEKLYHLRIQIKK